jgi:serine/threonine protein kinase
MQPNIVSFVDAIELPDRLVVVTELVPLGSLAELLSSVRPARLDVTSARRLLQQLLRATQHLHRKGIIHGNISAENVLVESADPLRVRLCGFGSARRVWPLPRTHAPAAAVREFDNDTAAVLGVAMAALGPEAETRTQGQAAAPAAPRSIWHLACSDARCVEADRCGATKRRLSAASAASKGPGKRLKLQHAPAASQCQPDAQSGWATRWRRVGHLLPWRWHLWTQPTRETDPGCDGSHNSNREKESKREESDS